MYHPGFSHEGGTGDYENVNVQVSFSNLTAISKCEMSWAILTTMTPHLRKSLAHAKQDLFSSLKIVPSTKASGWLEHKSDREEVSRYGQMDRCTKVTGWITKQMAREDSSTPMVMSTTEAGKMIKHTVMAFTAILTVRATWVTGRKTSSTEKVSKPGQTAQAIKVNMSKAKNTASAASLGRTTAHIQATSSRTTSKEKVSECVVIVQRRVQLV